MGKLPLKPTRRLLLPAAALGIGALGLAKQANAATPFTTYAFPSSVPTATGSGTDPDRWADLVINVKRDFGAKGDGITDDTTAIQNAVYARKSGSNALLGTIYFPPGAYKTTSPIFLPPGLGGASAPSNCQWRLIGSGVQTTNIGGTVNGFIFDSGNDTTSEGLLSYSSMEDMLITNNSTTANTTGCVRCAGMQFFTAKRVNTIGMVGFTTEDVPASLHTSARDYTFENCGFEQSGVGGVGFVCHGDSISLIGCEASGNTYGAVFAGTGMSVFGCHFEVCTTGIALGLFGDLSTTSSAAIFVSTIKMEGCGTFIDFVGASSGLFQDISIQGEANLIIGGVSNQTSSYGIRLRDSQCGGATTFWGIKAIGNFTNQSVYFGDMTGINNRVQIIVYGAVLANAGPGTAFSLPNAAQTAESYAGAGNFQGCNFVPTWIFSNLPIGANVLDSDTYEITDGSVAASGNFAVTNFTGGGSNHLTVRARLIGSTATAKIDNGSGSNGNVFNVTASPTSTIVVGSVINDSGSNYFRVSALGTGTGGTGTYTVQTLTGGAVSVNLANRAWNFVAWEIVG